MKILPFIIIGLVGLTALGASIYIMKSPAPHPQVAETTVAPLPTPPPPSHPFASPPETTDQNTPPAQTTMASPPTNSGYGQPLMPGQGNGHMQRFFDQLGLSDAQKQQIAQIRQTVTDRQQRRDAIRAVLTPDQQAKFDQMRAQFRNNRGGGGPGAGGPAGDNGQQGGNPTPPPSPAPGT
jgi:Spy/CpxP family protein refolding chaperone